MSAAAPYWGDLPKPKVAQPKSRRTSDDYSVPPDSRQSLDGPPSRANRASTQTTKSDVPSESTYTTFASQTPSSVLPSGLAPRPPSLPYGTRAYPPELLEFRRRRRSRNQEQDLEYSTETPPPAPEAPGAPAYKRPPGNGGIPSGHPSAGRPGRPMEPDEYYKSSTPDRQEDYPVLDRTRASLDARARRNGTDPTVAARRAEAQEAARSHQRSASGGDPLFLDTRRASVGRQQSEQRRKLADDRSPLQRLELTLDSITKEEKRSRVEAAEQAVREKVAGGDPASPRSATQQVRFTEEPQVAAATTPTRATRPIQAAHQSPLAQNPPEEGRRYGSVSAKSPRTKAADPRIQAAQAADASGIPQRNLSFRERAAKNDLKLPNGFEPEHKPTESPVTTPGGSIALTRTGSNKLRKNPPGDPWFSKRQEAEDRIKTVQFRPGPAPVPSVGRETAAGAPVQPVSRAGGSVRGKGPAKAPEPAPVPVPVPVPVQPRLPPAIKKPATDFDDILPATPSPPTPQTPAKLVKANSQRSQRKVEQILGRTPPPIGVNTTIQGRPADRTVGPSAAAAAVGAAGVVAGAAAAAHHHAARRDTRSDSDSSDSEGHHVSDLLYRARNKLKPGEGVFKPTQYLDEWRKATVGTLAGTLLNLEDAAAAQAAKDQTWWETPPSQRRGSLSSRPNKAEAFDGEYDDNAPTRFKPPLYLKCGPLLRYCGIRQERVPTRSTRNGATTEKEIWRGTVMIVTQDSDSQYDIAPTLRLFAQPVELLPPPPAELLGDEALAQEYVDPIAGHPKVGRKGETLFVRPADHLDEGKDLSRDESDEGLYEKTKSPPDVPLKEGENDPPGSFASRRKRANVDGEKLGKYKDIRGFKLHAERGCTFWRFNIEVELRDKQQRIAYRINRGPPTGFWVPAKGQAMNIMFHSCNGFSLSVNSDEFSGPDPMWRDVLNTHQSRPFHVMIGGGDQVYNDACMRQVESFKEWLMIKNPLHKHNAPFTAKLQEELEVFYLERYCMWFSQGLFGLANSQIPMVNMYDDHDIIDGFGSYPHHLMNSPVFSGLGNVAFKYYMLFQHQSVVDEMEADEPSWLMGVRPGPYITEQSRSLFMSLGSKVALLAVDARTERSRETVIRQETWDKIMDRCYNEIVKGKTEHLLVLLGVPIAYPRLVWLENILTSRLMDPVKALGKTGLLGGFLNKFDGGVEVLDDLDDHWTAKTHKSERKIVIEDLQDLAADKSVRITILSGDVHLAAVGQFYSNKKLGLPKHKDFRYMPNVISSAIVNTPPPDLMADILNKRNKVHHFDKETDEDMIPVFGHGVDGKPRNNKRLLPHRNWCSIREYVPGNTPPPTPPDSAFDGTPLGTPQGGPSASSEGGLFRRFSSKKKLQRGPAFRGPDGVPQREKDSRPPLSGGGGLFRSFSRRRASEDNVAIKQEKPPGFLKRTFSGNGGYKNNNASAGSTGSGVGGRFGSLFRRQNTSKRKDDGGINGNWGPDTDEEDDYDEEDLTPPPTSRRAGAMGLRGGGGSSGEFPHEYNEGDESYFTVRHRDKPLPPAPMMSGGAGPSRAPSANVRGGDVVPEQEFAPKPFHRTPTGLSAKEIRRGFDQRLAVNIDGGLEICLNVEVSQKDPTGITVPYRLVVPKLWYDYEGEDGEEEEAREAAEVGNAPGGIRRLFSLRGKKAEAPPPPPAAPEEDPEDEY
ncbi:hypothetical protein GQ53DRAFT_307843 [Thozetella sp. PMI_491]|nr:hypothetical protein GQ53DRAFT_307843 [Thozetella sp. PMI_491]